MKNDPNYTDNTIKLRKTKKGSPSGRAQITDKVYLKHGIGFVIL